MTKEIALIEQHELAIWDNPLNLKEIRELFAPNLTDLEFKGFVNMGKASGLNPFLREIWAVKYDKSKPAQYFIGRDGYRKSAMEHPLYDYHRVEAVYSGDDFQNRDGKISHAYAFAGRGTLLGAYCMVKRKGSSEPLFVSVLLSEYDKKQSNWNSMKETMIKKVAEAQGLKAAFPDKFAGTYSEHEQEAINHNQKSIQKPLIATLLAKKGLNNDSSSIHATTPSNNHNPTTSIIDVGLCNSNSNPSPQYVETEICAPMASDGESKDSITVTQNEACAINESQLESIALLFSDKGLDKARQLKAFAHFGVTSANELTQEQANEMIKILNRME